VEFPVFLAKALAAAAVESVKFVRAAPEAGIAQKKE
jgi:hypothetical protein